MLQNYDTIIWDWNGTLFNDVDLCICVINEMLKTRNLELLTQEKYREIFDFPVKNYYKKLGFDFKTESFDKLGTEFITNYNKRQYQAKLFYDSVNVLNELSSRNIKQYILSAREEKELELNLKHFNISHFFSKIVGLSNHYAAGKGKLAEFLINSEKINQKTTLIIGDTCHDAEIAQKQAINCILIDQGHQSRERLLKCNNIVLSNLTDILNFFKK